MTKSVENVDSYSVPCDQVFALLISPDAVKTKYEALGNKNVVVLESRNDASGAVLKTERDAAQDLPGYVKKVVGEEAHLTQTDTWSPAGPDGARTGKFNVETKGAPATIGGTLSLEPTASGCRVVTKGNITVKIPLIGKKFEGFTADSMKQQLADEYQYHLKQL